MPGPLAASHDPRPLARARGAVVHAALRRSRRDRHQDRAARRRRRHARVGTAVPQGRGGARHERSRVLPLLQSRQAFGRRRLHAARRAGESCSDLARQADVLVENFKVGGLAKYGLDYASVAAVNPRLVYASITGFGQDGPYADRAGYDFIIQGMSRIHERHRRARRSAGRRTAEGGCRDHRPDDGDVRDGCDPGGARASRPHRRGAVGRRVPVRLVGRDDGGDEPQLSRHGQGARTRRQRASRTSSPTRCSRARTAT